MRVLVAAVASLALAGCGLAERQTVTELRLGQNQFEIADGVFFVTVPGTFVNPDPLTEYEVPAQLLPYLNPAIQDTDVGIWVALQSNGQWLALWDKDALSSCDIVWMDPERTFVDPCSGSVYDLAGQLLRGPSVRDLGAFTTTLTPEGKLQIDTGHYTSGRDR